MTDAVTPELIVSLPAATILGNNTGSTAAAQALSVSAVNEMLGSGGLTLESLGELLSDAPTTEPSTPKTIWVSSGAVKVTSSDPPSGTVDSSDANDEILVGESVTITYTQTGGVAATAFQLRKNGTNQGSSQGTGVFVLTNQQTSDSGTYDVVATNSIGSAASTNSVALSVINRNPFYSVSGFSDTVFFESAANAGLGQLGTFRVVLKLLAVPSSSLKWIVGKYDATGTVGGWYLRTGFSGAGQMQVGAVSGGSTIFSPAFTYVTADIGSLFVIHGTITGGKLRLYVGGSQVGTGTTCGANSAPTSGEKLGVGKWQHATNLGSTDFALVNLATSTTALTADQIHVDAAQMMARSDYFDCPTLPGQTERWDAYDMQSPATNWVSRGPGSLTLTKTGSPTITGPL